MSQDISLAEAAKRAYQVEVICRMLKISADELQASDLQVVAELASKLAGNVAVWLLEEEVKRKGAK